MCIRDRACYGCMKGTTTISAEYSDDSKNAVMWIQDGEKIIGATGRIIVGSIMIGISSLTLIGLVIITFRPKTATNSTDTTQKPNIEILEAIEGKPVRFRINDRPSSNSAWVGIYPFGIVNEDHGKEGERWKWLRDIDVNDASFSVRLGSKASIRVFSDGGHTLHNRVDFEIVPRKKGWWEA